MESLILLNQDSPEVEDIEREGLQIAWFSTKSPHSEGVNEDSCGVFILDEVHVVLAVADGMGGHRGGDKASRLAIESLRSALEKRESEEVGGVRDSLLKGFEEAHEQIKALGIGAGTTLSVAHIFDQKVRFYNVGDSVGLLLGGRGTLKYKTLEHSAAGFGIEAGFIKEEQANVSDQHHLLLNVLGAESFRVEMSNEFEMSEQDMVLLVSDGYSDNSVLEDIDEAIVKGSLKVKLAHLKDQARSNMESGGQRPAKPDDLTLIMMRRKRSADASA